MIRFSYSASLLRLQVASLSGLIAGFVLVSSASALDLDFNVASGNYATVGNWLDTTNPLPVAAASAPTAADTAYIRNNGTVTINSDVEAALMRIGYARVITNPDYDNSTVVDAGDYVLWRKGSTPLANELVTLGETTPEDYEIWRLRFGGTPLSENIGQPGTLNWTAGKITGPTVSGNSGGPQIQVGRLATINSVVVEVPGTVVQNGPSTELILPTGPSRLDVGDAQTGSYKAVPLTSYTLVDGTIGTVGASDANLLGSQGSNGNSGIHVKSGTFTMTGGQIIDVTPSAHKDPGSDIRAQRFLTLGDVAGLGGGMELVSRANLNGGTINSLGGIRMANKSNTRAYLNINGATIVTGGDTQVGTSSVNSIGEMNMTAGSFQVGRTDANPDNPSLPYALSGRFIVGDSSVGIVNVSGGSMNVTRNVVIGNNQASTGSIMTVTGTGTITTGGLEMRRNSSISDSLPADEYAAKLIVDGPGASFITTGSGLSGDTIIGNWGKALFEVKNGGTAVLGGGGKNIQLGNSTVGLSPGSQATIKLDGAGSKLTLGGPVIRTNIGPTAPIVSLTGGTLEFNNTTLTTAQSFSADLTNTSTQLITKAGTLLQVTVGNRTQPLANNFAMSGGSWDIDIDKNIVTTLGADWFNASAGFASLTGGTLNLNFLNGTPADGQKFRILRGGLGTTLNAGAVTITGAGAGHWTLLDVPFAGTIDPAYLNDREIQLQYSTALVPGSGAGLGSSQVPEPASAALVVFAAMGLLTARRPRSRARA